MQTLAAYLLKLSVAKMMLAAFDLNNREAKCEHPIRISGTSLPSCIEPTYLVDVG